MIDRDMAISGYENTDFSVQDVVQFPTICTFKGYENHKYFILLKMCISHHLFLNVSLYAIQINT